MSKRDTRNTKGRIVEAAWKLFYEQGYDDTTVEEIIEESQTSKGSFYHYFNGKDALLGTLSMMFDKEYDALMQKVDQSIGTIDLLLYLNHHLFMMIENKISMELLARLLSSQLVTRGEKHLLDRNRTYFKLLRQIVSRGQENGELDNEHTVNEIVKAYAMFERALMYDWCLSEGDYSLSRYADWMMPQFLKGFQN